MNKEETKALGYIVLGNCIMMGCFTALAIICDKWWIILFSMIFWKSFTYKTNNKRKEDKKDGNK